MPDDRAGRLAELVKSAVERGPESRAAFLEEECRSDPAMHAEAASLLQQQEGVSRFIEVPALHLAAESFLGQGALSAGQIVGHYEIVSLIGSGGMGEVYLAQDRQLDRRVALKLIRRGLNSEDIIRHFKREEHLLASLNHPNIAQLYGSGLTADGVPFFVMEYVEGQRLDDYCNERKLETKERLQLFRKVCSAVTYAHQRLVIHRDLKPANVRVTAGGEPKLLDFGIAKLIDAENAQSSGMTLTLQGVMTPEYASPEQVRGESMTTASDVYSLGVVLYELLTGQRPYRLTSRRPEELSRAITDQAPARPSSIVAAAPPPPEKPGPDRRRGRRRHELRGDLDNIVLMAMRKEPSRRYESAAQFSADIQRHLEGLPVVARKDTFTYRASKFVRRHKAGAAAAVLVALALIGGLVATTWQARVARQERDIAQREKLKTEHINRFLQRMLSFSNQSHSSLSPVAQKKDVTVNAMLDQITPQVETELADQPEVRAEVLRTIGSAYNSQGQYDRAEKNLRAALETQRQLYGEENPEVAATSAELGSLFYNQGKFGEANRLLEKAVAFYRAQQRTNSFGADGAGLAQALNSLGDIKYHNGDVKAAISLLDEALRVALSANLQGSEREVLALIKADLGGVLVLSNEIEKGEPLLRESLAEFRQVSSQPREELGVALTMLGICALKKKEADAAEKFLLEGEQVYRQTLGDRNSYLTFNLQGQANALSLKNDLEGAIKKAREALALCQEIAPSNRLLWIGALRTLGDLLTTAGRTKEAEDYLRQALTVVDQQTPPNLLSVARVKTSLSQSLLAQNRLPEAEKMALEAYDGIKQSVGAQNPLLKPAAENLIEIYEKEGKHDAAEKLGSKTGSKQQRAEQH